MPRYGLTWDDGDDEIVETTRSDQKQPASAPLYTSRFALDVGDSSDDELDYSDDDGDEDEDSDAEADDPIQDANSASPPVVSRKGFSSTRYSLDETTSTAFSMAPYFGGRHFDGQKHRFLEKHAHQNYPPLNSYIDGQTAPPESLRRLALVATCCRTLESNTTSTTGSDDDDMEKLAQMLKSTAIVEESPHRYHRTPPSRPPAPQQLTPLHVTQQRLRMEQEEAAASLRSLLQNYSESASKIIAAEEHSKMEHRKAVEEQEQQDIAKREAEQKAAKAERLRAEEQKEKEQAETAAKNEAAQKKEAAASEHITRANKLRTQLVEVQKSVAIFDASKQVSKRRLNMKKIVNGRVNTLAENTDKIRSVAAEVLNAIAVARQEDATAKEQGSAVPPEMSLGKRYLLNLLASNVIVRAQAEGFNGQRGDGFPLANMLALISAEAKDFVPVMTAHIFSICPTAVPTLPQAASDAVSEEALMESLGMLRLPERGEFESFERFLSRTEGVMSLVANIMASEPSNHGLMGGHEGAVKWLHRFLLLLPPTPQSPLPLITAPVLDAFLTGAGHMMAKMHANEFQKFLDSIINDISTRLDESSIGMPSATRLRKTIRGGFEGFKQHLPSRALPELYYGADGSGGHTSSVPSSVFSTGSSAPNNPFGSKATASSQQIPGFAQSSTNSFPFGKPPLVNDGKQSGIIAAVTPSPFGSTTPSPLGSTTGNAASSPFGSAPIGGGDKSPFVTANQSPFGNPSPAPFSQPSPFGTQQGQAHTPSPFGVGQPSTSQASSPFAPTLSVATSPFGNPVPASTPFGDKANASASPFGGVQSNPSPFGGPQTQVSTFGTQPQSSPFGASHPTTPFGSAPQSSTSFGAMQPAGPFGAQQQATPFGSQQTSPFGAPQQQATPFGSQQASPFGAPQQSAPFGSQQQASPFSAPQQSNPFGSQQQASPFGTHQQNSDDGRLPCKFFAQGRCKFGDKCRSSHTLPNPDNTFANPFGGPRR